MDAIQFADSPIEHHTTRAEIFYREGRVTESIQEAKRAIIYAKGDRQKVVALKIFIARAYAKLGQIEKSNEEYRKLFEDGVYLPSVLLGLMHNNLEIDKSEKAQKNVQLVKIFIGDQP